MLISQHGYRAINQPIANQPLKGMSLWETFPPSMTPRPPACVLYYQTLSYFKEEARQDAHIHPQFKEPKVGRKGHKKFLQTRWKAT